MCLFASLRKATTSKDLKLWIVRLRNKLRDVILNLIQERIIRDYSINK
jgi:hypothetical protein